MTIPERYSVEPISGSEGKDFVREHHYTHGIHNGPMCYGMSEGGRLVGVLAFATPSSEAVCSSVFGPEYRRAVTELHRLVLLDECPKNSESFLIARALKQLRKDRPHYAAVLSFADSTQGHVGTIYQATNALYCGTTSPATFYRDRDGRLRHPRQNGSNITKAEAERRGWVPEKRGSKHRYLFLLPMSKSERKTWMKRLLLEPQPYPKS